MIYSAQNTVFQKGSTHTEKSIDEKFFSAWQFENILYSKKKEQ